MHIFECLRGWYTTPTLLSIFILLAATKRSTERKLDIREGFCEEAGRTEEEEEDEKPKDKFLKAGYNDPATEANVRNQSAGLDYRVMRRISGHLYSGITSFPFIAILPFSIDTFISDCADAIYGVDLTPHERVRSGRDAITNTVQRSPGIRAAEVLRCLLGVPITRLLLR
ncbi:hypothetical protein ALC62_00492 [Cyphomyrmex costatus]|uniref:Uncharacterized protein n=1 Tax=Cyphomyrmex costatus TaxID=456900 RepID=A0A195D6K7_9HYME|nr:hypothetical protein ALC62_00492 [Cyphomyrmex costatus]